MPITAEIAYGPAARNDVAGVAIGVTVALHSIAMALHKISADRSADINEEIEVIRDSARRMSKMFDELAGWVDE